MTDVAQVGAVPTLTQEQIEVNMKRAREELDELNEKLDAAFRLSDSSRSLVLR